ncbi:MAG: DUF1499 domain-containing protein [Hyphomonadaceae bacterium]
MASVRDWIVRLALLVAMAIPIFFAFASLGSRFGLITWQFGLGVMTMRWGPLLLMGAAGLAVLALLLALLIQPRRGWRAALAALLIPALGLGYAMQVRSTAGALPPLHDVSTDLDDPPNFSERVTAQRALVEDGNSLEREGVEMPGGERWAAFAGMSLEDAQRSAYPDIAPTLTSAAPDAAYAAALEAAQAQGWTIGETDEAEGRIEATAQSFWFGFIDDIAIRVRPQGEGSRIDVRSVSRVGLSDLGANAARIRAYREDLRSRLPQ